MLVFPDCVEIRFNYLMMALGCDKGCPKKKGLLSERLDAQKLYP